MTFEVVAQSGKRAADLSSQSLISKRNITQDIKPPISGLKRTITVIHGLNNQLIQPFYDYVCPPDTGINIHIINGEILLMQFRKNNNLQTFEIIRSTGNQSNILGLVFKRKSSVQSEEKIKILPFPWYFKSNLHSTSILNSVNYKVEAKIKQHVLRALDKENRSLNTQFCLSKIYYYPLDLDDLDLNGLGLNGLGVYHFLTRKLITYYFEKNELNQFI